MTRRVAATHASTATSIFLETCLRQISPVPTQTVVANEYDDVFLRAGSPQPLVDALEPLGFEKPTPVQAEAIPTAIKPTKITLLPRPVLVKQPLVSLLARLEETQSHAD